MILKDIFFPVYYLGKRKPMTEDGMIFYINKIEEAKVRYVPYIIDDKNLEGDTLGKRRIEAELKGAKLQKIKYSAYFFGDMLKLTKGTTWFIDSKGNLFSYKKTKRVPLIFKKIKRIIPIRTGGSIVEVDEISQRFKVLFTPQIEHKTAGLLVIDKHTYILYGLYNAIYDKTTRMI